jgi:hypothetical protein
VDLLHLLRMIQTQRAERNADTSHECIINKQADSLGLLFDRHITTQKFVPRHGAYIGIELITAIVTNVAILRKTAPSSLYVNRRFGGQYRLHFQRRK